MNPCLIFLMLLHVTEPQPSDPIAAIEADWAAVIKPVPIDDQVRHWFWRLDPRPAAAFTLFTNENLSQQFIEDSRAWCRGCFKDTANPFEAGLTVPTAYSLAPFPGRLSLLQYRWIANDYAFTLQEGSAALLLEVRQAHPSPTRRWQGRWTRETLIRLLGEVFVDSISSDAKWIESLRIPEVVRTGNVLSSAEEIYPTVLVWPPNVLIIPRNESIAFMVLKDKWSRKLWGTPDESNWIAAGLSEADGKLLVIERLWGRAYPRDKRIPPILPRCVR